MIRLDVPIVAGQENLSSYLPQKHPFVMVENLWSVEENITVSSLTIQKSNILVEGDYFSESGLMENMAQTAGLGLGYVCIQKGIPVPVGFFSKIQDIEVYKYPQIGEQIFTHITQVNEILNFLILEGKVFVGETLIAKGELRVFVNK